MTYFEMQRPGWEYKECTVYLQQRPAPDNLRRRSMYFRNR